MSEFSNVRRRCRFSAVALVSLWAIGALVGFAHGWSSPFEAFRQLQMILPPSFDRTQPEFSRIGEQRHLLLFSKTNGYRDYAAIADGQAMLEQIAAERYWFVYATENAAIFAAPTLGQFDSVVFNNVSGPLFTPQQQAALADFTAAGGGVHSLNKPSASPAFRQRFAERIKSGSMVDRSVARHSDKTASKTPTGQRSRQPALVSQSPAPQP